RLRLSTSRIVRSASATAVTCRMCKTSERYLETSSHASAGYQPFQLSPQPRHAVPSNFSVIDFPFPETPGPSNSTTFLDSLPPKFPVGASADHTVRAADSGDILPSPAGALPGRYCPLIHQRETPNPRHKTIRNGRRPGAIRGSCRCGKLAGCVNCLRWTKSRTGKTGPQPAEVSQSEDPTTPLRLAQTR